MHVTVCLRTFPEYDVDPRANSGKVQPGPPGRRTVKSELQERKCSSRFTFYCFVRKNCIRIRVRKGPTCRTQSVKTYSLPISAHSCTSVLQLTYYDDNNTGV